MLRTEASKPAERISSAIYFVTSFFDNREPLKWKLRTLAINIASNNLKDKSGSIKEILSLFTIAKNVSIVSELNYELLMKELTKFDIEEKNHSNITFLPISDKSELILRSDNYPKDPIKDKKMSAKKNGRQETILNIIRRKKEVMIKDITSLIDGCSEKTIQRELLSMVKSGIIKKDGEKRWSRYSLA